MLVGDRARLNEEPTLDPVKHSRRGGASHRQPGDVNLWRSPIKGPGKKDMRRASTGCDWASRGAVADVAEHRLPSNFAWPWSVVANPPSSRSTP